MMKRKFALLLALATTATLYGCGSSDTATQDSSETSNVTAAEETTEDSTVTEDESTEATADLSGVQGTYVELFPEFAKTEYKDWWVECINAYETDAVPIHNTFGYAFFNFL